MERRCAPRLRAAEFERFTLRSEIDWSEFAIVRASDIPGENTIVHLTKDHPCLAAHEVNHPEEPILLIAHREKTALLAGVAGCTH